MSPTGTSAPTRKSLDAGGLSLSYLEWESSGSPLVLVHGFMGAASNFWEMAERLAPRFRVLAPDLRGHGYSGWPSEGDYSMESYQRDLDAWFAALGLARFDLLGHSLGGPTVAIYAARHPEQVAHLVLEDPARFGAAPPPPGAPARSGSLFPQLPLNFPNWDEAVKAAEQAIASPRHTKESQDRYLDSNLLRHTDGTVTWRLDRGALMAWLAKGDPLDGEALFPFVAQLQCPTLIIRGGNSRTLGDAALQRMLANPRVRSVDIAGAGHGVHFDKLDELLGALTSFLAS